MFILSPFGFHFIIYIIIVYHAMIITNIFICIRDLLAANANYKARI